MNRRGSAPFRRRLGVLVPAGLVVAGSVAVAVPSGSAAAAAASGSTRAGGPIGPGPAGGYTPSDLAVAYGYHPAVSRSGQTVAVVAWGDDPHIAADLGHFDTQNGYRRETAVSFRKVNQAGKNSPLPPASTGRVDGAAIATEVEAARGVCNTCRLLLVEATSATGHNIAAAENTAVRLGATEVANVYAEPEKAEPAGVLAAFRHPGVVITAPSGDDGWWGWDFANQSSTPTPAQEAPDFPASDPDVISVGGTGLELNNDATIQEQFVWNEDGVDDRAGTANSTFGDATGGGCSKQFSASPWQKANSGYAGAQCGGKRLSADVSAVGDPATGFDVYDTWGAGDTGWKTLGGTALGTAIVAAMYALEGGAAGAAYPGAAIYENAARHPADVDDIVNTNDGPASGNGFCGGDTTANCGNYVSANFSGGHSSPNALGAGDIDCSFPLNGTDPAAPPPLSSACNAVPGLDGPSGVGTPASAALFAPTNPKVAVSRPKAITARKAAAFSVRVTPRLSGTTVKRVTVNWGDHRSTTGTSRHVRHTYRKNGHYTVTVTVIDSLGQQTIASLPVTVRKSMR